MYEVIYFRKGQQPQLYSRHSSIFLAMENVQYLLEMYQDTPGFTVGIRKQGEAN